LKALLPVRNVFPSLLKVFHADPKNQAIQDEPRLQEEYIQKLYASQESLTEAKKSSEVTCKTPTTFCPLCRQPFREPEGQPLPEFLAATTSTTESEGEVEDQSM